MTGLRVLAFGMLAFSAVLLVALSVRYAPAVTLLGLRFAWRRLA